MEQYRRRCLVQAVRRTPPTRCFSPFFAFGVAQVLSSEVDTRTAGWCSHRRCFVLVAAPLAALRLYMYSWAVEKIVADSSRFDLGLLRSSSKAKPTLLKLGRNYLTPWWTVDSRMARVRRLELAGATWAVFWWLVGARATRCFQIGSSHGRLGQVRWQLAAFFGSTWARGGVHQPGA